MKRAIRCGERKFHIVIGFYGDACGIRKRKKKVEWHLGLMPFSENEPRLVKNHNANAFFRQYERYNRHRYKGNDEGPSKVIVMMITVNIAVIT